MKKVIQPLIHETSVYYSDFTNECMHEFPPVEITILCNYGSKYDGEHLTLHLTDKDLEEVLDFIKTKIKNSKILESFKL
jgi:hypothetical protein